MTGEYYAYAYPVIDTPKIAVRIKVCNEILPKTFDLEHKNTLHKIISTYFNYLKSNNLLYNVFTLTNVLRKNAIHVLDTTDTILLPLT